MYSDFPHPIRTSSQSIPVVGRQDNLIDFQRCGLSYTTFQQERFPKRKLLSPRGGGRTQPQAPLMPDLTGVNQADGQVLNTARASDEGWPEKSICASHLHIPGFG